MHFSQRMPGCFIRHDAINTDSLHHCQVGSLLCKYPGDNRQNTGADRNGKRLCWNFSRRPQQQPLHSRGIQQWRLRLNIRTTFFFWNIKRKKEINKLVWQRTVLPSPSSPSPNRVGKLKSMEEVSKQNSNQKLKINKRVINCGKHTPQGFMWLRMQILSTSEWAMNHA